MERVHELTGNSFKHPSIVSPRGANDTWPTSELRKTVSATVSTWLTDGRFNFHTRITDNFVDA